MKGKKVKALNIKIFLRNSMIFAVLNFVFFAAISAFFVDIKTEVSHAADMPYVSIGENVWLLDIDTGRKLFLLPETYYAPLDNIDGEYYVVTFNGIKGKVNKDSVSVTGYHTTASGTVQEIKIDAKFQVFTAIKLKSVMEGAGEEYPVPTDASLYFIGKYPAEENWYYVRYNEVCGYIKAEYTTAPDLQIAPFVPEQPQQDNQPEQPKSDDGNLTKILVITGVCVAAVVVLIIIFIPKKKGTGKYYYEDTE